MILGKFLDNKEPFTAGMAWGYSYLCSMKVERTKKKAMIRIKMSSSMS